MVSTEEKRKIGKRSRAAGQKFEVLVRSDLESKGYICDKWTNNVDLFCELEGADNQWGCKNVFKGKLVKAKVKWAGPGRPMMMGAGFPDFIAFRYFWNTKCYEVIGVEAKINGYLDPAERKKCEWLLKNKVFSKILIAKKTKVKNRIVIDYEEFK